MKKTHSGHTIKNLKEFCKYIMDTYISINSAYEDSKIYYQLKQFYEEGMVKDIIYKNTDLDAKQEWLEITARRIDDFYQHIVLKSKIIKIKTKL